MALFNLVHLSELSVAETAARARVSRATLTPPPDYTTREAGSPDTPPDSVPGRLTIATARSVQRVLHTVTEDRTQRQKLAALSLVGLVSRLNMSLENLEVQAPARWLEALHQLDTDRENSGLVRADDKPPGPTDSAKSHLSAEEIYMRAEALVSRVKNLHRPAQVQEVVLQLEGQYEFERRYIDPLIRLALTPPGKGVEAITTLARIGLPALSTVTEHIHQPWGFRLYRVLGYAVHGARGGGELTDGRSTSTPTTLDLSVIRLALDVIKEADAQVRAGNAIDIYPGRCLQLDLVKEISSTRVRNDQRESVFMVDEEAGFIVDLLECRLEDERRPSRERCYAAWLLHHLSTDPAWSDAGISWDQIASRSFGSAGLDWAIDSMGAWGRHASWSLSNELVETLQDIIEPVIERHATPPDRPGEQATRGEVAQHVQPAVVNHLIQALVTPNGRWRRQVSDALRASAMQTAVGDALSDVLRSTKVPDWVKDRACFVLGFVQCSEPSTIAALIDFGSEHLDADTPDSIEAAHAAILAVADILGLSQAPPSAEPDLRARAVELFNAALQVPPTTAATRLDLAGAYGLKLVADLETTAAAVAASANDEHREILSEWVPFKDRLENGAS